jgi:transcriptional regulator with XRE-family HTH domain
MAQTAPDFGKATKLLRQKQGISQTELRKLTGLEASYISRLENGKFEPTVKTIIKLAKAFKISVTQFVDYAENHHSYK